jgi:plastocyanin
MTATVSGAVRRRAGLVALTSVCLMAPTAFLPRVAFAQGVAERPPNLLNTWSPSRGVVQFNFTHRFDMSDAPLRKITNTPSFQVTTGVVGALGVGFTYGSNSDLVAAYPNEWEWFARWSPLSQGGGAPLDASLQGGWNLAAESFDAELSAARSMGRLRLVVAGRAFHHAFYRDTTRYAVAGGAVVRLSPWLSVAGDYATLIDRGDSERPVWGAGLQLTVPYTPHSMSIHASNVGTGSLEGISRGSHTRWGFEYTVPITLRRYAPQRSPRAPVAANGTPHAELSTTTADAQLPGTEDPDTVVVTIRQLRYERDTISVKVGDVVVWRNADPLEHTVTADSGAFGSPLIKPGQEWSTRFTAPGRFAYHCMPHPFMKAVVHVRAVKP